MNNNNNKRPVHEIRLGRIKVSIWGRQSASGNIEFYSVPSRLYKDEDKWAHTNGYYPEDLPVLTKVLERASVWIWKQNAKGMPSSIED